MKRAKLVLVSVAGYLSAVVVVLLVLVKVVDEGWKGRLVIGAAVVVLVMVGWKLARSVIEREVVKSRQTVMLIPNEDLNPSTETIRSVLASVGSSAHRSVFGWLGLTSRVDSVILTHRIDPEARMIFTLTGPRRAIPGLLAAVGTFGTGVVVRAGDDLKLPWNALGAPRGALLAHAPAPLPALFTSRRSYAVTGRATAALALTSDVAGVTAQLAPTLCALAPASGEDAVIALQLRPLGRKEARAFRVKLAAQLDGKAGRTTTGPLARFAGAADGLHQAATAHVAPGKGSSSPLSLSGFGRPTATKTTQMDELRRVELGTDRRRQDEQEPLFHVRVMIAARATNRERAHATVNGLAAALAPRGSGAHFTPRADYLPAGLERAAALLSNWPILRTAFDSRLTDALMRPTAHPVMGSEIAALSTPSPRSNEHPGIRRAAPVDPAPMTIPVYRGATNPGLLPLTHTNLPDGRPVHAGIPWSDVVHAYITGKSGSGKTEQAKAWIAHLAKYTDHGIALIDPQGNAIDSLLPHLTELGRPVYVIDMREDLQPSWAVLSMEGRRADEADDVVTALSDAIANSQGWNERNIRARTLLEMCLATLVHINTKLCAEGHPELQTTPLHIPRLISNDAWRESFIPHLPGTLAGYWTDRFPSLPADAKPVVTNLFDNLPGQHSPRGTLLGQPRSTFSMRQAMTEGAVVLFCTGGTTSNAKLLANLFLFDAFREGLGRKPGPHFWLFADEAQVFDGGSHGKIAESLELLRQWRFHIVLMNQSVSRLTEATRGAMLTNRAVLMTSAVANADANLLAKELGGLSPNAVKDLNPRDWITQPTIRGVSLRPFKGTGTSLASVSEAKPDGVPALLAEVNERTGRTTRAAIADHLERHPERISTYLRTTGQPTARPKMIDLSIPATKGQ